MFLPILLLAVVAGIGAYAFCVEPLWFLPILERATPGILYRAKTQDQLVALSFDDGPHPVFTPQVLEILRNYDAKATFFLIGERALRNPELVLQIKLAGHEVANHYFKNGPTFGHSDQEFLRNLELTDRAIAAQERTALFRPPGGLAWPRQLKLARQRGYTCVLGCAYPHDPMQPPLWYIRWLIEKNLSPGTIVILHDGIPDAGRAIASLPHILEEGYRRGLRFTSIGELLKLGAPASD